MEMKMRTVLAAGMAAWLLTSGIAAAAPAPDSKRLAQAKDYIADEQWTRAIGVLKAAADDPHEKNRDEALFWLAHSEHQSGDDGSAIQTIARLEREYPASPWVKLAGSVRVEIAQRLRRDDVLWWIATPPPPTAPPPPRPAAVAVTPRPAGAPSAARPATPAAAPPLVMPQSAPPPPALPTPAIPPPPGPHRFVQPTSAPTPLPPSGTDFWFAGALPDPGDQVVRIEALAGLIDSHGDRVIPLLKEIALDRNSPDEARRALIVLARSQRPEARIIVAEVARTGTEPVRIAAIRELGRFPDPNVNSELVRVYSLDSTPRIKRQVMSSLGERADTVSLYRIVKTESDSTLRDTAILTLGRIPTARDQLRQLYTQTPHDSRAAVIGALFLARDDDGLIRIASTEREPLFRERARQQLRLLATPKAIKFLTDNP
jgi:HEAT repeats